MPGVDYVGHILNAMVATANSAHQKAQNEEQKVRDAEEQRSNQMREKYQNDALAQAKEIADKNFAHLQEQNDLARQAHSLQEQIAHKEAIHQMHQDVYSGITKLQPNQSQIDLPDLGISIPQGSQIVDGEALPASSFATNEDRLNNVEQTARRAGMGQFEGLRDPQEVQKAAAATALATQKEKAESEEKRLDRISREKVASIMAGAKHGIDPEGISATGEAVATGDTDLTGTSPAAQAVREYLNQSGQKPFSKKQADQLRQVSQLNQWFDQIRDFANKHLYDSKLGAIGTGLVAKTGIPTEAKNEFDILKTNAINAGKALEGTTGRITVQQLNLLLDGMASMSKTRGQVLKDADNLQNRYKQFVNTGILGGIKQDQRDKILTKFGLTESDVGAPTSLGGKQLTREAATKYLTQAGGDKVEARKLAKKDGFEVAE